MKIRSYVDQRFESVTKNVKIQKILRFFKKCADFSKIKKCENKQDLLLFKMKNVHILWASTREVYNYIQAKNYNCSIITMPPSIIEKISKFGKSLNRLSLDTVRKFFLDSKKSNFKL